MRILLATDGSDRSLTSAQFLSGFPHRRDVHVHIFTVLDSEDPTEGELILSAAKRALGDFPEHVTTAAGRGNSSSEIVEAILLTADLIRADLIVLCASGQSAIARFFLGSIAEAVSRYAEQSVLLTRPPVKPLQSVIIGIDGSQKAQNALDFATSQMGLPADVAFHLIQVLTPHNNPNTEWMAVERERQAALTETADRLQETGQKLGSINTPSGNAAVELLRVATEKEADLIIVGSQGMSAVDRFGLGSVAERVLRHAPCSVLLVKQQGVV